MGRAEHDAPTDRRSRVPWILSLGLVASCLTFLAWRVIDRSGNLAWDDADYLRRALSNLRLASARSGLLSIPSLLDRLLMERPRPPLLIGWLAFGAMAIGRRSVEALVLFGALVPFGILAAGIAGIARRSRGAWAATLSLVLLMASPRTLAFGGKIMVETFLGLWVALALVLAAELTIRPTRRRGLLLGAAVGLAFLTKTTAALLFAGALIPFFAWITRAGERRKLRFRAVGWALAAAMLVAGPWYARNGRETARFALFSSRYDVAAEGRPARIPTIDRLLTMTGDLPGWPVFGLMASAMTWEAIRRIQQPGHHDEEVGPHRDHPTVERRFLVMVATSLAVAGTVLLFPSYFDSRFLLPIWPSVAIAGGMWLARSLPGSPLAARCAVCLTLMAGLATSAAYVLREPRYETPWAFAGRIDDLVARHGVRNLANVGDTVNWNVNKTGLINELRDDPASCQVVVDLSAASEEVLRARLPKMDGLVLLEPGAFPPGFLERSPRLNRGLERARRLIEADPGLVLAAEGRAAGLPPMKIYVRNHSAAGMARGTTVSERR